MARKPSYYKKVLKSLEEIHTKYPNFELGRHLETIRENCGGDFWGISDRELLFQVEKYMLELELDVNNVASEDYVNRIIEDAKNLFREEDDYE